MSVRQADQLPFETVGGGKDTQRQVLIGSEQSPHFAMRRFVMQPGGGMPRHTNTVEHEQYVLRGRATIGIGRKGIVLFRQENIGLGGQSQRRAIRSASSARAHQAGALGFGSFIS